MHNLNVIQRTVHCKLHTVHSKQLSIAVGNVTRLNRNGIQRPQGISQEGNVILRISWKILELKFKCVLNNPYEHIHIELYTLLKTVKQI